MRSFLGPLVLALLVGFLGAGCDAAPRPEHLVLISIDGLRPDVISETRTPNLAALIARGSYCGEARTITPPVTLPSHTAMLTGLDHNHHGVTWNDFRPGSIAHPTLFSIAKTAGRSTAMLFAKNKFHYLVTPGAVDFVFGPPPGVYGDAATSAEALAAVFEREWARRRFAVTFVHFREPDESGHKQMWLSPEYMNAVETADRAVGRIARAIAKARAWDRTVLIVTSDHGGAGNTHAAPIPENLAIPWLCVGSRVPRGTRIHRTIMTYSTTPTALALLGIPVPGGLDGDTVAEVFAPPPPFPGDR
jgi:predicted AlkP superfamily pyrophosphatase or phosphodiesterase